MARSHHMPMLDINPIPARIGQITPGMLPSFSFLAFHSHNSPLFADNSNVISNA